jgi:3-isopropylmalate/(R)-2-methylmalate dehydratase large subunit
MTITEKILAAHSGKSSVAPGELINVKVDVVLGHDVTGRTRRPYWKERDDLEINGRSRQY